MKNQTKDKLVIVLMFLAVFFFGFFVARAVAENIRRGLEFAEEYKSRPVILRAETEQDRIHNKEWRRQYSEYYEIPEEEVEQCLSF